MLSSLLPRLHALLHSRRHAGDLAAELDFHRSMLEDKLTRQGLSPGAASAAAAKQFGAQARWQERLTEQWQFPLLENLLRDIGFSLRLLRKSPAFTAVAVATLAIGIGANTAIFSVVDTLLFRPLPVPHADHLAVLHFENAGHGAVCAPLFHAVSTRHDVFSQIFAYGTHPMQARGTEGSEQVSGMLVSGEFFAAMRVPPQMGRYLTPADDQPHGAASGLAVVISDAFWRTWFSHAPDVIGRKLTLAGQPFTVVGVMPKTFMGPDVTVHPKVFVPLADEPIVDAPYDMIAGGFHAWWLSMGARLTPGVTLDQANAVLAGATESMLRDAQPEADWLNDVRQHHARFTAVPGARGESYLREFFRKPLLAVFALCGVMLLLACLNLTSLLLARSAAREHELATRLALGASRSRLLQQLLVESCVLAVLGTAAGLLVSPIVAQALTAELFGAFRDAQLNLALDLRVFAFAAASALLVALLVGVLPALRATSARLNDQLKDSRHAAPAREGRRVLPRLLLSLEVALALVLVSGAGLLAASLLRLRHVGLGFEPHGLASLSFDMGKQSTKGSALTERYRTIADSIAAQPAVASVSYAAVTPFSLANITSMLTGIDGRSQNLYSNTVGPAYFATMRTPLLRGREFTWSDTQSKPQPIILNQSAAKALFGPTDPIGHILDNDMQVIGVVGDAKYDDLRKPAPPTVYFSAAQQTEAVRDLKPSYSLLVRLTGPAAPVAAAARRITAALSPDIPAPVLTPMNADIDNSIASERMLAQLAVFFAACALLVTGIGLYGTLAYTTARRTTEIGIRIALGAQRAQVALLVFRENLWIALTGTLAGLAVAFFAARALTSFLYDTSVRDPWVLVASALLLGIVSSLASLLPALRAASIDPNTAIRTA